MTFSAILSDLYRRLRYTTAPPSAVTIRLKAFVNETQRELLTLPGMERLRDDTLAVTAFANKSRSGLPPVIARIKGITDRTNNHKLRQVPLSEIRLMDPAQAFTGGFPLQYAVAGYQEVQNQPAAATGLWAVSTVAGDNTQTVHVQTITTGGYGYIDSKVLNGTTRVQIGATATRTDHLVVEKFYLTAVAAGYISLYDAAAAGNELGRIEPGQLSQHYLSVEWFPVQTADTTVYVDCMRNIQELVQDADEPLLPVDFHRVVIDGARWREYEFLDDSRVATAEARYMRGQAAFRSFVLNDGDRIASLRRLPTAWSQLGAQFPAGS